MLSRIKSNRVFSGNKCKLSLFEIINGDSLQYKFKKKLKKITKYIKNQIVTLKDRKIF